MQPSLSGGAFTHSDCGCAVVKLFQQQALFPPNGQTTPLPHGMVSFPPVLLLDVVLLDDVVLDEDVVLLDEVVVVLLLLDEDELVVLPLLDVELVLPLLDELVVVLLVVLPLLLELVTPAPPAPPRPGLSLKSVSKSPTPQPIAAVTANVIEPKAKP